MAGRARTFVAPGKVVIAGEYAVLDGAPALVAAVDIGVRCTVSPGPALHTSSPTGDTRFVDAALAAAQAPAARYAFDDHNPPPTDTKPGLGGSGAATVVATYAARALNGLDLAPASIFRVAYDVHHTVQGSGSGVDVAASSWGGMLSFVRGELPTPVPPIDVVVVWSGASASTGPRVARYTAWAPRDAFVQRSADLVADFHRDPIAVTQEAGALLRHMADAAGIPYLTPALEQIRRLAERHGGAAKPSGAGGGDCAVAFLPSPDAQATFAEEVRRAGYTILSTSLAEGVHELTPAP